jgi:hypothetical protein
MTTRTLDDCASAPGGGGGEPSPGLPPWSKLPSAPFRRVDDRQGPCLLLTQSFRNGVSAACLLNSSFAVKIVEMRSEIKARPF